MDGAGCSIETGCCSKCAGCADCADSAGQSGCRDAGSNSTAGNTGNSSGSVSTNCGGDAGSYTDDSSSVARGNIADSTGSRPVVGLTAVRDRLRHCAAAFA
jgi:hypothetical protein